MKDIVKKLYSIKSLPKLCYIHLTLRKVFLSGDFSNITALGVEVPEIVINYRDETIKYIETDIDLFTKTLATFSQVVDVETVIIGAILALIEKGLLEQPQENEIVSTLSEFIDKIKPLNGDGFIFSQFELGIVEINGENYD
jgi:hypothetical protein